MTTTLPASTRHVDGSPFADAEEGLMSAAHDTLALTDQAEARARMNVTLAIDATDIEAEVVEIASGYLFDLRAQRLISGSVASASRGGC